MKPKKYPYTGSKIKKVTTIGIVAQELVVFPNVSFKKELIKHVYTVIKDYDNSTLIYFRIPKIFGAYEEQRVKVKLSYEETLKILNNL